MFYNYINVSVFYEKIIQMKQFLFSILYFKINNSFYFKKNKRI